MRKVSTTKSSYQFITAALLLAPIVLLLCEFGIGASPANAKQCPWHCKVWLDDGCNTCSCVNGQVSDSDCEKAGCPYPYAPGRCIDPPSAILDKASNCRWFGTAPFCDGSCPPGYSQRMRDQRGDGKKCASGSKVYCCAERRVIQPVSFCRTYADTAIAQHRRALDRGCSVSGPEWSQDFFHHINWCLMLESRQPAVNGQQYREQFLLNHCR